MLSHVFQDVDIYAYLTVMGMVIFLPVSLSYSPAPFLIKTYLFFSFSAASGESRGPHLLQKEIYVHVKLEYIRFKVVLFSFLH